jgi:meso-butanediol dehydrogenase / (S,S)-butanediol dehydrogenase / diacetyl reductase
VAGRLEGKVALITGTGGNMGRVAALRFTAEGAQVVGCDVSPDASAQTVKEVEASGRSMTAMAPVDLGDSAQARQWVDDAAAVHGRIDILYNNASAARMPMFPDMTDDDWEFTRRNELDLIYYVTHQAWPHLQENGGVVLNVASIQGHVGTGFSGGYGHAATKAGVAGVTRQLAAEGGPHGIRAVAMSPGPVRPKEQVDEIPAEMAKPMLDRLLIQRFGYPEDVVNLAVFLVSDEASWITGTDYVIDGGFTVV